MQNTAPILGDADAKAGRIGRQIDRLSRSLPVELSLHVQHLRGRRDGTELNDDERLIIRAAKEPSAERGQPTEQRPQRKEGGHGA